MSNSNKEQNIENHVNHLQSILDGDLFNTLRNHFSDDEVEMLLFTKEAVDRFIQKSINSGKKIILNEQVPYQKDKANEVSLNHSSSFKSILGSNTYSSFYEYYSGNEEIMIKVINDILRDELNKMKMECPKDTNRYKPKKMEVPLKAIREMCVECMGGRDNIGYKEYIKTCGSPDCSLYDFRLGTNPFRSKMELSSKERKARSDRAQSNFSTIVFT